MKTRRYIILAAVVCAGVGARIYFAREVELGRWHTARISAAAQGERARGRVLGSTARAGTATTAAFGQELKQRITYDPAAAMEQAAARGVAEMAEILAAWSAIDPDAARAWALKNGSAELATEAYQSIAQLSLDPRVALALWKFLPPRTTPYLGVGVLARAGKADLEAWLAETESTELRHRTLIKFSHLHPENARAVLDVIAAAPESNEKHQLMAVLLTTWSRVEPIAVVNWLARLDDPQLNATLWGALTADWAQRSPVEVANIAAEMTPGAAQEKAVLSVLTGWAARDPQAAASWLSTFAETPLRAEAIKGLITVWSLHDASSAYGWLLAQPVGSSRNAGFEVFKRMAQDIPAPRSADARL